MSSLECKIVEQQVSGVRCFIISGYVSEHAQFPKVEKNDPLIIKFHNVTGLNSVGTRTWVQWFQPLQSVASVTLEEVPSIFIKAFNRVVGTTIPNMKVKSFFVPFLSPEGERKDILFVEGRDFNSEGRVLTPPKIQDNAGKTLELDVLDDYFQFLKK